MLVAQLLVGRRAIPLFWRAYADGQLKDRMQKNERALLTASVTEVLASLSRRRLLLLAERGFVDVDFFALLDELGGTFLIRTKASVKVLVEERWQRLEALRWDAGGTTSQTCGASSFIRAVRATSGVAEKPGL